MSQRDSVEWHGRMLRAWHLALLRFAVTLDHADRANVAAIAGEIDRGCRASDDETDFKFFRKSSAELCAAILREHDFSDAILRQYVARLDDGRLKRAFAAVVGIEQQDATPLRRRSRPDRDLWRGLPSRSTSQH